MEDMLIKILSVFDCPILRQGSMAQEEAFPKYFFTFWNNSAENKYHSNDITATIWNYDLNFYGICPKTVYDTMSKAIEVLKEAGFIVSGKGYDVASDETSHIGRGIQIFVIEERKG